MSSIETGEIRPKIDTVAFMKDFRKATHFREIDEDLIVTADPIGLERVLPDGSIEKYMDKMDQERGKGRNESVSYGRGNIGGNKFVGVVFNWEFMAGTSGVIAGEKFVRAMHIAVSENLPMIVACTSGGQRQQEGVAALREMSRTVHALNQFKIKTNQPLIFILAGNVWGGLTASGVPMADLVIGMEGTDFGFAGRGPIKAFEGVEPAPNSQTVENSSATNRSVHVVLKDSAELYHYLGESLKLLNSSKETPGKPKSHKEISGLDFDHKGFHAPFRPDRVLRSHSRTEILMASPKINNPETTWDQQKILSSDVRRPDTLYMLMHAFDGFVPLFSGRVTEENGIKSLRYPAIVAALAYIDDPRLSKRLMRMVIGNQPSYLRLPDDRVLIDQQNSNPTAWDYKYQAEMVGFAKRLEYQITSLVNTLGARPKLEDELATQFKWISACLQAQLEYPYFTSGYLLGTGGSGGHLATDFTVDYAAMLGGAQEYVAEPRSAAAILYPRGVTQEDIERTAEGMKPGASDLLSRGLVDNVIWEPEGGAQNHPFATARLLREDIISVEMEFGRLTPEQILERRILRVEDSHPVPMGHLSGRPVDHGRARLSRLFHTTTMI